MHIQHPAKKVRLSAQKRPGNLDPVRTAGSDMNGLARRIANHGDTPTDASDPPYDVVIVGAGAGGIACAAGCVEVDQTAPSQTN